MKEVSIKELFTILRNRIHYLILIPLLVLAATVLILRQQPDYYSAQTKLYVLTDYTDSSGQIRYDADVSTQFAGDFKELIKTPQVIQATENALGNSPHIEKNVAFDVSAVAGTRVLKVTATSRSPELSRAAANTISKVFVEYIARITKADTITIASEAVQPATPSSPARLKISIAAYALTLLLLSVLYLALEIMNTTLRTSDEVESATGLPVLANIEDYRKKLKRSLAKNKRGQLLGDCVSVTTRESVKTLATNVEFCFTRKSLQTLMITSTFSVEGKSSLSILLAEALANDNYRVLIVDTDFRKPCIGELLRIRNKSDIIDYIYSDMKLQNIVSRTHHDRVHFIDYAHAFVSTSHIYNYNRFRQLIQEAKNNYDVVLFDTPPLGFFIDAAILSGMVDGTLLSIGKGVAKRERVKDVIAQLQKANANIIGTVLNFTDLNKRARHYSNRYYRSVDNKLA